MTRDRVRNATERVYARTPPSSSLTVALLTVGYRQHMVSSTERARDRYDFVIFGATGFTAGFVLEEIAQHTRLPSDFTWALAGRNEKTLLKIAEKYTSRSGVPKPGIIVADVKTDKGLLEMAHSAKR